MQVYIERRRAVMPSTSRKSRRGSTLASTVGDADRVAVAVAVHLRSLLSPDSARKERVQAMVGVVLSAGIDEGVINITPTPATCSH